ncbi:MAG: LamG domain-containing protein [Verrucomicrobiaceae bacterium]|nr:MAG: LamG domain-containing protein [Verrucomicrobiaceae bacterium]
MSLRGFHSFSPFGNFRQAIPMPSGYRAQIMALGPLSYWRQGELSGNPIDETGNYNGVIGGTVTRGLSSALMGDSNSSYGYNAGYIEIASPILGAASEYTVIAFMKGSQTSVSGGKAIYCERGATGNNIVKIEYARSTPTAATNVACVTLRGDTTGTLLQFHDTLLTYNIKDGNWHQIALVRSGTSVSLYVDGKLAGTGTFTGTTYSNSGRVTRIGSDRADSSANLVGGVDEVSVFNHALSGAQIASLWATARLGYLVAEDWQGVAHPAGWVNSGVDSLYSTAPIVGTQSLRIPPASGSATTPTFEDSAVAWTFLRLRKGNTPTGNNSGITLRNGSTTLCHLQFTVSDQIRYYMGSSNYTIPGTVPAGVDLALWLRYESGNGSNGKTELYIQTDGSENRPSSPFGAITAGTSTLPFNNLRFSGISGTELIFDKIRIHREEIGSNPP